MQTVTVTRLGDLGDTGVRLPSDVRTAALHLVWRGVFRVELMTPLPPATLLEQAE